MNIYILDDDIAIVKQLELIIESEHIGNVVGYETDPSNGIDEIIKFNPDIVLIDLLMPSIDGIAVIEKVKENNLYSLFVMISQVSDNDLKREAYESGIEFFINKPINKIEVIKVIENMISKRILQNISSQVPRKDNRLDKIDKRFNKINRILISLGISGEKGTKDLLIILKHIIYENLNNSELNLTEICDELNIQYRNTTQRIRRALSKAMRNLAYEGLHDFYSINFSEYANTLFQFSEVKKEMDYIKDKGNSQGTVNINMFINSILILTFE